MTPDTIGDDAVVYGQDIQSLQEKENPPPSYGNHLCDPVFVECPGYSRAPGVCMEQGPDNSMPCRGDSTGRFQPPVYCC